MDVRTFLLFIGLVEYLVMEQKSTGFLELDDEKCVSFCMWNLLKRQLSPWHIPLPVLTELSLKYLLCRILPTPDCQPETTQICKYSYAMDSRLLHFIGNILFVMALQSSLHQQQEVCQRRV